MKKVDLSSATANELFQRFAEIACEQDRALLGGEIAKFNRLYDRVQEVSDELKRRPGINGAL